MTGPENTVGDPRRSIATRLLLMLIAVFAIVLAGVGMHLYSSLGRDLAARAHAELHGRSELVQRALGELRSARDLPAHREHFDEIIRGQHPLVLAILDTQGSMLYDSASFGVPDARLLAWIREQTASALEGDMRYRDGAEFLVHMAKGRTGPPDEAPVWIAMATDVRDYTELLSAHGKAMLIALVLGGTLAALGGMWVIRKGLAPVRRIAFAEGRVTANRLDTRIALEDTPLELEGLVRGFNAMLDRLDSSFRRISEFSSDLAHELRSPINSLIGRAQVALSRPRTVEEYRAAIESIAEDGERVARIVRDMLFLARADNASAVLKKERVDLRAEVDNLVAYFDLLAEERGVAFACDGHAEVRADRMLVQRAISNLFSNALWHTPRGGTVHVNIHTAGLGTVCLEVGNPGPGIPAEHLPRLFDRFYQVDPARRDASGGTGLGLAIVKSIMKLHDGSVGVASTPGELTTFELKFSA